MQSGGGVAGQGRNPAAPPPGRSSASSSPSPSSSSSAQNHLGLESIHNRHQQQQQQQQQHAQQLAFRQSLQQQQLRRPEGEEGVAAYRSGGIHGAVGGSNSSGVQPSHPPRKFNDLPQQHGNLQFREENQNKIQGLDQLVQNPVQQAYLQYAIPAAQQKSMGNMQVQQGKMAMFSQPGRSQDIRANNLKMQELMSLQAANQAKASMFKKSTEHFGHVEKQLEQGHTSIDPRSELKPSPSVLGQLASTNTVRPVQALNSQVSVQSITNNPFAMAQLQAMQAWAMENNIDLSLPANATLIAQLLPLWQSRVAAMQKPNESSMTSHQSRTPSSKQQMMSSPVESENSAHANSLSEISGQTGPVRSRQAPCGSVTTPGTTTTVNPNNMQIQQLAVQNRDNPKDQVGRQLVTIGNGGPTMHPPQVSGSSSHVEQSNTRSPFSGPEASQMQHFQHLQPLNRPATHPPTSTEMVATQIPSQGGSFQVPQLRIGFTKQQLHVLKAQILAFRRLKRGEKTLPQEVLRAIAPPLLDLQPQQIFLPSGMVNQDRSAGMDVEEHARDLETNIKPPNLSPSGKVQIPPKEEFSLGEEKAMAMVSRLQEAAGSAKESMSMGSTVKVEPNAISPIKSEQEVERANQNSSTKGDPYVDKGKMIPMSGTVDSGQIKKLAPSTTSMSVPKDIGAARKYHGPLFDFPFFTRKHDSLGSTATLNNTNNLTLAYDVKDLLYEEGMEVLNKKREENLRKIGGLLAVNLERKRIRPDLVVRLQIEERKLRLLNLQARLRDEVDQQQQEIMAMSERPYRKFVRQCERQRSELIRQVQLAQKVSRERQLKSIFQWRKKLLEAHWAIRDARTTRNRGVAKYHERMLREFSKKKDDDRNKRMEALKNNDVDRYREMLLEQQTNISGDACQRFAVLSSFLSQTEEYLHKLGGKITAAKNSQEVEEAANAAAVAARSQGLSEEEVKAAAACAGQEVMIRNRFSEMNAPRDNSSVNKYYNLAHAVNERVARQPSMLRAGTLRDYQLVGLQWMLSLYNNKLNGILADEMGLGKTVQVMALIAYLMEFKGNYGPHLIIVPNAVLVNWKSELHNWLPSVSCIFYVGGKDQRSKLFSHEVLAMKFNVLVTTYEFVMYDRSKLSKVDWKYIIIDEAQRMKDRESVLARDLDRYRCQRRLLLTGTPLQNDLKELWSLLNLLLPEVFDNRKAFHDWFSRPFQKDVSSHNPEEDDWLETEKKVIIIHRLHQILEPFMLRRRVEDVEGSLPPKVSIVLKCRMSAMQSAIYDWIKSTGTIRVDPEDEMRRVQKNPMYQVKMYKNLNNKCMELRKACNHPLLNYPYFNDYSEEFLVRSCGKLWILDRILIKLQRAGHRVLLFSTMTKLLDILEEYLQWRRLVYRRIDGTTSLEDREIAIVDFNRPGSDCFIFLLSIRAAGRGLNLQTADTVVIYDPDPNPQNEEQAVARAHRIGQKREVKVIYMEAVVDKISSHQKEDELRNGGAVDSEDDDLAGKDRYVGSIESLIRNNIQQYKIDMADEVINAGRFDQRTTHEERRMTLETLLRDEERYQENVHDVPSLQEVNRMTARSKEEIELFDRMDEEFDWTGEMMSYNQVPKWLRAGGKELNAVVASLSKKPSKNILAGSIDRETSEIHSELSPGKTERRGRPKRPSVKSFSVYRELDDEDLEDSDASSEERNAYPLHEEGEIEEYEDEEYIGVVGAPPINKDQSEEEGLVCDGDGYLFSETLEAAKMDHLFEEAGSSGSSSGSRRLPQLATPSISSQKFGSLSALEAKPDSFSKRTTDELEEGEIAASGDSHVDPQQSGSWVHDRDDCDGEQVLQPKIKRKRSIRIRPRYAVEKFEEKANEERLLPQRGSQLPLQPEVEYDMQSRTDPSLEAFVEPVLDRHDTCNSSMKQKRNMPSRKVATNPKANTTLKSSRLNNLSGSAEEAAENSRESWTGKAINTGGPTFSDTKMSDVMQRKCKNVVSKLQRKINKDGHQIIPILSDFLKKSEGFSQAGSLSTANNLLDLRKIDQRVDQFQYQNAAELIADVQLMLKNLVQYCNYTFEVRSEARKLQDLFFDIMKIAFPDTDFREARSAVTFSVPGGSTAAPSPKQAPASQSKRHKPIHKVEPEPTPIIKAVTLSRRPGPGFSSGFSPGGVGVDEDVRAHGHLPKVLKESRPATASTSSGREQGQADCSPFPTHPGDLVICKKKRKDRDKTMMQRVGPVSPPNSGRLGSAQSSPNPGRPGPTSPFSNPARAGVSRGVPIQKDHAQPRQQAMHSARWSHQRPQQQQQQHQFNGVSGGGGGSPVVDEVQWAKPVKRMRTDTGKRRPSHM